VVADQHLDDAVLAAQPRADLAPVAELFADVDSDKAGLGAVLGGDVAVFVVRVDLPHPVARVGRNEIAERVIDGLVELRIDVRIFADPRLCAPFARPAVDGRLGELRGERVAARSLEVVFQPQAEAKIIRPPRFLQRLDDDGRSLVFSLEVEVHAFKRVDAVNPVDVFFELLEIELFAQLHVQLRRNQAGGERRPVGDLYGFDGRRLLVLPPLLL